MKCGSCKEEINSKMKFAIAKNTCPACGKKIFSEIEFFFRKQLSEILDRNNVKYPEQVTAITDDIIELIDNQAKGAREKGELGSAQPDFDVSEAEPTSVGDDNDSSSTGRVVPTAEEEEFIRENGVIFGDGSTEEEDPALAEIRAKAEKLKKKVRKTSVPKPITLREN